MKTVCFFSGDITRGGGTERVSTMIANALAAQGKYRVLFLSLTEQADRLFFFSWMWVSAITPWGISGSPRGRGT